jgi:hypothetical protein
MNDRVAQFYVAVARVCADAALADIGVRMRLANGDEVAGVPAAPRSAAAPDELDGTGYADGLRIDGVLFALSAVVAVTLEHPDGEAGERRPFAPARG